MSHIYITNGSEYVLAVRDKLCINDPFKRLFGGREPPDSTYNGLECFNYQDINSVRKEMERLVLIDTVTECHYEVFGKYWFKLLKLPITTTEHRLGLVVFAMENPVARKLIKWIPREDWRIRAPPGIDKNFHLEFVSQSQELLGFPIDLNGAVIKKPFKKIPECLGPLFQNFHFETFIYCEIPFDISSATVHAGGKFKKISDYLEIESMDKIDVKEVNALEINSRYKHPIKCNTIDIGKDFINNDWSNLTFEQYNIFPLWKYNKKLAQRAKTILLTGEITKWMLRELQDINPSAKIIKCRGY